MGSSPLRLKLPARGIKIILCEKTAFPPALSSNVIAPNINLYLAAMQSDEVCQRRHALLDPTIRLWPVFEAVHCFAWSVLVWSQLFSLLVIIPFGP